MQNLHDLLDIIRIDLFDNCPGLLEISFDKAHGVSA